LCLGHIQAAYAGGLQGYFDEILHQEFHLVKVFIFSGQPEIERYAGLCSRKELS